jgi:hypothetical protein
MKAVKLMGGLGNQMFQYAFGVLLGPSTEYDVSWFDEVKCVQGATLREYELDFWNVKPSLIKVPKYKFFGICKIKPKKIVEKIPNLYDENLLKYKRGLFEGYFQVAQYYDKVRDQLLKDFTPRNKPNKQNKAVLDLINSVNAVSIHVRRGDYVKLQNIYGVCDLDYYKRAVKHIAKNVKHPHFFIFSDDIKWVKDNLKIDYPCEYIDFNHGRDSAWDIWLMANCKHNIIANSSFSWWGAWLNKNQDKIVIAPQNWFADGQPTDIVPTKWLRM